MNAISKTFLCVKNAWRFENLCELSYVRRYRKKVLNSVALNTVAIKLRMNSPPTLAVKDTYSFPAITLRNSRKWPVYNFNLSYLFRLINLIYYTFRFFELLNKLFIKRKKKNQRASFSKLLIYIKKLLSRDIYLFFENLKKIKLCESLLSFILLYIIFYSNLQYNYKTEIVIFRDLA